MAGSSQIYGRYLVPLLPALALMAAIAAVAADSALGKVLKSRTIGMSAGAVVIVAMLVPPAMASWTFSRDLGRPSTVDLGAPLDCRERATRFVDRGRSRGLAGVGGYQFVVSRSLPQRSFEDYVKDGATYILAAAPQFQAMLRDPAANRETTIAYRALLDRTTEVAAFEPSATVSGPSMRIYRMPR